MVHEVYHITIKGHLDPEWSDWFDGLTITLWTLEKLCSLAHLSIKPPCMGC